MQTNCKCRRDRPISFHRQGISTALILEISSWYFFKVSTDIFKNQFEKKPSHSEGIFKLVFKMSVETLKMASL